MSEWDPNQFPFVPPPFRFNGWDDPSQIIGRPPNSVDDYILDHQEAAGRWESLGYPQFASKEHEKVSWWKEVLSIPDEPMSCNELWADANKLNNAILAKAAGGSKDAMKCLDLLTRHLLSALRSLAAHEVKDAAVVYLNLLMESVDAFESLARLKPGAFNARTKSNLGIPGLISPFREKTKSNEKLVELLEVGKALPIAMPTGGKGNALSISETPSNLWAVRLLNYIEMARTSQATRIANGSFDELMKIQKWTLPAWLIAATNLAPFSKATWNAWFDVAWQIVMLATGNKPELEAELVVIGKSAIRKRPKYCKTLRPQTKSANVRAKIKERLKLAFKQLPGA